MQKAFSDGALLQSAWKTVKENIGFFIGGVVVTALVLLVLLGIAGAFADNGAVYGLFMLLYYVAAMIAGIGWIKIYLSFIDGKKPSMGELFKHWDLLLKYLGVNIVYGLLVTVGMFLFMFPGIIWALKYSMAPMLVVDKGMGPIEAMKKSAEMTTGVKWDLLGFFSVIYAVALIGMLALFIGLVVAIPVVGMAMALVYRHLLGSGSAQPAKA